MACTIVARGLLAHSDCTAPIALMTTGHWTLDTTHGVIVVMKDHLGQVHLKQVRPVHLELGQLHLGRVYEVFGVRPPRVRVRVRVR